MAASDGFRERMGDFQPEVTAHIDVPDIGWPASAAVPAPAGRAAGEVTHPGDTERLHEYWVHGEGAAKIRWGEPGDFDRCVVHLGKYIRDPEGYCNLAHHAALGIYPATHAKLVNSGRSAGMAHTEVRDQMATSDINDLPDSSFAFIEPGGTKDGSGKTVPRSLRHFPIHDKAHADNAAARIAQGAKFGKEALPKVKAAQKSFGEGDGDRSLLADEEVRELRITSQFKDLDSRLEIRSDADGQWIGGYASVFMPRESRNLGGFIERVAPGAFNEARAGGWQDVVCRYNHNDDLVLGTAAAGTLRLRTDNVGLDYQVLPPESRADVRELVARGDVRYSSFAFRCRRGGDEWGITDQNFPMRTLHDVDLVDVAPVLSPAYPDATAAVRATSPALRSLANHMQIAVDEVRALAEADELRRLFIRTDRPMYKKEVPRLFGPQAATLLLARREDPYVGQG